MSVRSFARLGSSLSIQPDKILSLGKAEIEYISSSDTLRMVASTAGSNDKSITLGSTNSLHGTWTYETSLTSSDRRLKTDINPLIKEMVDKSHQKNSKYQMKHRIKTV